MIRGLFLAASLAWGQSLAPVAPPEGSWAAFVSAPERVGEVPFATLGLDPSAPGVVGAFAEAMDRSELTPAQMLAPKGERTRADVVQSAATLAVSRLVRSARIEARGSGARGLEELEALHASLQRVQPLAPMLSVRDRGALLEAEIELSGTVSDRQTQRLVQRAEALRRDWAEKSPGEWAGEVDALAAGRTVLPSPKAALLQTLIQRQAALGAAIEGAKDTPLEFIAERKLRPRLAQTRLGLLKLVSSPSEPMEALREAVRREPLGPREFRWLSELSAYAPIDPALAAVGREGLEWYGANGKAARGLTFHFASGESLIVVEPGLPEYERAQVALHEGFHQGDRGYGAGRRALQGLFGSEEKGGALATVLLEGYTELRARKAFLRLVADGKSGRTSFAKRFLRRANIDLLGWEDPGDPATWERRWKEQQYEPYVSLVRELAGIAGGREALEAFVSRGETAGLVRVVGIRNLARLASVAAMATKGVFGTILSPELRLEAAAGFPGWAGSRLSLSLLDDDEFRLTMRTGRAFEKAVSLVLSAEPRPLRRFIETVRERSDPKGDNGPSLWSAFSEWTQGRPVPEKAASRWMAQWLLASPWESPSADPRKRVARLFKPVEIRTPGAAALLAALMMVQEAGGAWRIPLMVGVLLLAAWWKWRRWLPSDLSRFLPLLLAACLGVKARAQVLESITVPVAPPAGTWAAFIADPLQAQSIPFDGLGLDPSGEGVLSAFAGLMDRTSLTPQQVLSSPSRSAAIRSAAEARIVQSIRVASYAGKGSDARSLGELRELRAELRSYERLAPLIPEDKRVRLLEVEAGFAGVVAGLESDRAAAWARALRKEWSDRWEDDGDLSVPGPKEVLGVSISGRIKTLSNAIEGATGPRQRALALIQLRPRLERARGSLRRLADAPGGIGPALQAVSGGRPLSGADAAWLRELAAYSPGIDPAAASVGREEFDYYPEYGQRATGWASPFDAPAPSSMMHVAPGLPESFRALIALHEGFHQGDRGYLRGRRAIQGLLGDVSKAEALSRVFIEGYTEYRAQQAFLKLAKDGRSSRSGFASRFGGYDDPKGWRLAWKDWSYAPYVALIEEMLGRPGGREALDAFVARGETAGLVKVLGLTPLARLAAVARLEHPEPRSGEKAADPATRLEWAGGLPRWLGRRLSLDKIDNEGEFRGTMRFARAFKRWAAETAASADRLELERLSKGTADGKGMFWDDIAAFPRSPDEMRDAISIRFKHWVAPSSGLGPWSDLYRWRLVPFYAITAFSFHFATGHSWIFVFACVGAWAAAAKLLQFLWNALARPIYDVSEFLK